MTTWWSSARGRIARFLQHPAAIGTLGVLLGANIAFFDIKRVIFAQRQVGVAVGPPVAIGTAAALGVIVYVVWYVRRFFRLTAAGRRIHGAILIGVATVSMVAFVWTHPKHGGNILTTRLGVTVVTYWATILTALVPAAGWIAWRTWRARRRAGSRSPHRD
jgi:hypothetical protein